MSQEVLIVGKNGKDGGKGILDITNGMAKINAVISSNVKENAKKDKGYFVSGSHITQAIATWENVMWVKNISQKYTNYFTSIKISSTLPGTQIKLFKPSTYTSGGLVIPSTNMLSKNVNDNSSVIVIGNSSNDMVAIPGNNIYGPLIIKDEIYEFSTDDSWILNQNDGFLIQAYHATLLPTVSVILDFFINEDD